MACTCTAFALAHGEELSRPSECTLPDLAAAWQHRGGSLPLLTDTIASPVAGSAGATYHVALQVCSGPHCEPGTWAGLFPVLISADGRYRVAVNNPSLWLDVLTPTGKAAGVMCEHAGCAPIRKIVQFELKAGLQWIQIVSRKPAELDFLVVPVRDDDDLPVKVMR